MLLQQISPFIRYARYVVIDRLTTQLEWIAYDARLFYVVEGKGIIMTNGQKYHMKKGSLIIVNTGTPYHVTNETDYVKYIVFSFDYTQKASNITNPIPPATPNTYDETNILNKCLFTDAEQLNKCMYIVDASHIEKKLDMIVREYNLKSIHYQLKISSVFSQCLVNIMRGNCSENLLKEKKIADGILEYIHNNSTRPLTNLEVGNKFGYHPNYISSIIKLYTGMPLHQYLIHVRLMNAVEMLESSHYPVGKIAEICGFCDIAYFSSYFKKHFGISPAKYRGI